MDITASNVYFSIIAKVKQFLFPVQECKREAGSFSDSVDKNLDKVNKKLEKFGGKCYDSFNSVAYALESAFSVAKNTLSGLVNSFADYGDTIAKMSQRTGIATQSLSEFDYIAGQCGTSLDTFETAIKQMEKTLAGAAGGAADAQKKLASIGVALYDIQWKSPDQQFRAIAEAIASLPDPSQRAAAAMAMFGRSGTDLLPLMNKGAGAIDALAQKAHELGLVLSDEDYQAAEDAKDAMDNFKRSLDGMKMQLSSALVPMLTKAANFIAKVSSKVIAWAQANPTVVRTIAAVVAAIATFVTGLYTASKALQALNAVMYLLNANPIILAISAVVAAVALLFMWYKKAANAAEEFSAAQKKLADEHKASRQKMNGYIDRLNELNSKSSLSKSEQAEMKYLVSELNAEYQGLGLTVDETTGKLLNLADAVKQINEAQRKQRREDLVSQIDALKKEKEDKEKYASHFKAYWRSGTGVIGMAMHWHDREKAVELQSQIEAKERELDALDAGMEEREEGIPFASTGQPGDNEPTEAQKSAASMAEDLAHANDTAAEQAVRRVSEQFEKIVSARAAELMKSDYLSAEEADQRAREELAGLKESVDAQIQDILDKDAEAKQKEADAQAKRDADEAKRKEDEAQREEQRKAEERKRYEVSEVDQRRSEFDQRDAGAISETLDKLEALEQERESFEKQAAMDRVALASADYNAKKEALETAQAGGDQEAIDKASKEFKEATEELAAAQQGAASVVSDQQRAIEEAEEARRRQMEEDAAAAEEASRYAHQAAEKDYESSKGTFNALEAAARQVDIDRRDKKISAWLGKRYPAHDKDPADKKKRGAENSAPRPGVQKTFLGVYLLVLTMNRIAGDIRGGAFVTEILVLRLPTDLLTENGGVVPRKTQFAVRSVATHPANDITAVFVAVHKDVSFLSLDQSQHIDFLIHVSTAFVTTRPSDDLPAETTPTFARRAPRLN